MCLKKSESSEEVRMGRKVGDEIEEVKGGGPVDLDGFEILF